MNINLVGGCQYINMQGEIPNCRHTVVQRAIIQNPTELTSRLSENRMDFLHQSSAVTFEELRSGHVDVIKGLFFVADLDGFNCNRSQSMVVFGKPVIDGTRTDLKHYDIARKAKLSDGKNLQTGGWGFILSPLVFSPSAFLRKARISFTIDGHNVCQVRIPEKETKLFDPSTGEINLEELKYIDRSTAEQFWAENVYAFLIRAARQNDKEVWAVKAESGIKGRMPCDALMTEFLYTLARHVAPEFQVYRFLPMGKGEAYRRNLITVSWLEAQFPNCLKWPDPLLLIQPGTPRPANWWGT